MHIQTDGSSLVERNYHRPPHRPGYRAEYAYRNVSMPSFRRSERLSSRPLAPDAYLLSRCDGVQPKRPLRRYGFFWQSKFALESDMLIHQLIRFQRKTTQSCNSTTTISFDVRGMAGPLWAFFVPFTVTVEVHGRKFEVIETERSLDGEDML